MRHTIGLAALLALSSVLSESAVAAKDENPFRQIEFRTDHVVADLSVINFFEPGVPTLVARGLAKDGSKQFSFFEIGKDGSAPAEPKLRVTVPEGVLFFDFGHVYDKDQESLLFFTSSGIQIYDLASGTVKPIANVSSIYKQSINPQFQHVNFAHDMNGDGLVDIVIADFDGYHLLLNDGAGGYGTVQRLDMWVEMRLGGDTPRYSQFPVYSFDTNFDDKMDIVFLRDSDFVIFEGVEGGGFASKPIIRSVGIDIVGNSFASQIASNERNQDQSDIAEERVATLEDMNGDGIIDFVTRTDVAKGAFNRSTSYNFYYGRNEDGMLKFNSERSAGFTQNGFSADSRFIDFTDDGRTDFAGGAVSIGIGKIIGLLFSGSISINVNFFMQDDEGNFTKKPTFKKKVSVDFDLSSGQGSVPVVEMTDIDGDGAKDLLLGKGTEELRIYKGTNGGKKLFARRAIDVEVDLPKSGDLVSVADVNGDGKGDVLIHFDRLGSDGAGNKNRIILLLAK